MSKLYKVLEGEIRGLTTSNLGLSFAELSVDSFDLVTLRAAVENALSRPIRDDVWTRLKTPADIINLSHKSAYDSAGDAEGSATATNLRRFEIGMPQMANGGLSESWLFKEVGDLQWKMIADGLGVPSGQLVDGNGDRLYATFTRIRMRSSKPFAAFQENEELKLVGDLSRYGAGIFLGRFAITGREKDMSLEVMSSFAKRSAVGSNKDLLKGQPAIPENCPIKVIPEKPAFSEEYRNRRGRVFSSPMFEGDYTINPYQDINGVGLLYFAAYPTISDTCELAFMGEGNSWARRASTLVRDICYFANSDADDTLRYAVMSKVEIDGGIEIESLISRKSDGLPMAHIITQKVVTRD